MKKLILFLTVLAFALTANVFAQTNTNVGVTADVLSNLTIEATDVQLGSISQGSQSVLNPAGGTLQSNNVGSNATLGTITLSKYSLNHRISVSWGNATLDRDTDAVVSSPLTFTPTVTFDRGEGNTALTSGTEITALDPNANPNITLSIGGTLDAPGTGNTGNYSTSLGTGSPIVFTIDNLGL